MYLKSLELHGFKSFPDKTVLEFGKGLTAVVGPNGSGKSNIGDAVRWVLGEQSSKTLRGGKMEDVIFGGTALRKPVSFASVTLNISNEDRTLEIDSDNVSIMRRLWRNGESEYLINGAQVRLKDVLELFMDTGLGRDGYSIIGQGRVADIVGSKSNERREIFEEAAGISKFRYKKEEAQRKLASAEDNILRLKDILSELEGRVEPLRIQSEKAKKYLELASRRKTLEISVWVYNLEATKAALADLENKLLVSNGEYEMLSNEIDALEDKAQELAAKRRQCDAAADDYRARISALNESNATAAADIAVYNNNIKHYSEQISDIKQRKEQLLKSESETWSAINAKQDEISAIENGKKELSAEVCELETKLAKLTDEADKFSEQMSGFSDQLNKLYIKRSELRFASENAAATAAEAKERSKECESLVGGAEQGLESAEAELSDVVGGMADVEKAISEHQNKLAGFNMLLQKKSEQLKAATAEYNESEVSIGSTVSRRQMLMELEKSMEGFSGSVKSIVSAGRSGRLRGIRGAVAGLISVEPKYSLAIETALGMGLQNIVVDNEECAKAGIRYLKSTNGGRATFLPLTSVKVSDSRSLAVKEKGLEMAEGYVGAASELVSCDDEYKDIVSYLLGRIAIAEDIDLAANIAKKYGYKFKIVTLDGQVINAGGSFTGGSSSRSAGMLSRKNEIDELSRTLEHAEKKNKLLKDRLSSLTAETQKLGFDVEGEKDAVSSAEADKIRFDGEKKRIELVIEQQKARISELKKQREESERTVLEAQKTISDSEKELTDVNGEISRLEELVNSASEKSGQSKNLRAELSNEISDKRLKLVELGKDIEAAQLYISSLKDGMESSKTVAAEYDKKMQELGALLDTEKENIKDRTEGVESAKATITTLEARIKQEIAASIENERLENETRRDQKTRLERREQTSSEVSRLTEKTNSLRADSESVISQLWESYNMTAAEAADDAVKLEDIGEARKNLNELKSKIRALGSVNTDAIDEYKDVSQRYEFLSGQLGDVLKSKSELERLIGDLTKNMRDIFSDSFAKINENFKKTFVELFGGGTGELKLTDPDNVLESGIEINVAPPGKVIKNLSLLSGGEQAFVAIAIYFAILKLRPSPFCILDEIEAALDDVNVTRYAQYLRNFTDTTQFILITHRRGTMEEADVLYGVTMQEKGVSKLLKMDVSDASFTEDN